MNRINLNWKQIIWFLISLSNDTNRRFHKSALFFPQENKNKRKLIHIGYWIAPQGWVTAYLKGPLQVKKLPQPLIFEYYKKNEDGFSFTLRERT